MTWLALLKLVLSIASSIFDWIERKQLMDAGEARAIASQMEELNARMQKAVKARESVAADAAAGRLRDDDGYRVD